MKRVFWPAWCMLLILAVTAFAATFLSTPTSILPTAGSSPTGGELRIYSPDRTHYLDIVGTSGGAATVTGSPSFANTVYLSLLSTAALATSSGGAIQAATATGIAGLWSGCSGTQYLGYDGNCHTAGTGSTTTVGNGTITLGTSAISSGACSSAATVTISGVATTDAVIATLNADPTSTTGYLPSTNGSLYVWVYPTSNTVNAKQCNDTGSSITPGSATLNVRVVR